MKLYLLSRIAFASASAVALAVGAHAQSGRHLDVNVSPCFEIFEIELDAGKDLLPFRLSDSLSLTSKGELDPPQFRCIGAGGIQLLIDRVQNELMARGFVTSRVLAEPQNLQSGKLKLKVLMGKIQQINWEPQANAQLKRATSFNTLPAKEGDILNLKDIEQGLENFKRVPTAEADIQIVPGDHPGYSNLRITHAQDRLFRFSVSWDDSGTPSTGKQQASATFSYDNWLTLSDLFYITVNQDTGQDKDPGSRGTHGKSIHYSVPLGYQLLSLNLSSSSYHQTVAGANSDIVYAGTSSNADIKLSRVIQRDASGKTTTGIKAFRRQSNNYVDDSELVNQQRVVGGWVWDIGRRQTVNEAIVEGNLAFKQGTKDFGSIPAPEEASQKGTSRIRIWNVDTNFHIPFKLFDTNLTYSLNTRFQHNLNRLTSQDMFSIGGRFTVRGFDGINTLSGDRGWLVRNDVSADMAAGHKFYVGIDKGAVGGPAAETLVGQSLSGAVIGLRGQKDALQYDFFVGGPIEKPDRFKTAKVTTGFNLSLNF